LKALKKTVDLWISHTIGHKAFPQEKNCEGVGKTFKALKNTVDLWISHTIGHKASPQEKNCEGVGKTGPTGIRTQVARIRTLSDNQLHYGTS
jgi:hypothetical protein